MGYALDEVELAAADDGFSAVGGFEFAVDGGDVGFDGVGGDVQLGGDLGHGHGGGQPVEDGDLAFGEGLGELFVLPVGGELAGPVSLSGGRDR